MANVNDSVAHVEGTVSPQSEGRPAPPPFYHAFTADNLSQLRELSIQTLAPDTVSHDAHVGQLLSVRTVPQELKNLVPPDIPDSEELKIFSQTIQPGVRLPPLQDYGAEPLFPASDHSGDAQPSQVAPQLLRVLKSVLMNFLHVTKFLSTDPAKAPEKLEDLRVLLLNAHRILNEHRPHQARETLIQLMQERVDGLKKQIEDVSNMQIHVDDLIRSVGIVGEEHLKSSISGASSREQTDQQRRGDRSRHLWKQLDLIELG